MAELEKKFDIPSVRKRIPAELAKQAVLDEVDKGGWEGSQHNGPDYIQTKLANRLVLLPRYATLFLFYFIGVTKCIPLGISSARLCLKIIREVLMLVILGGSIRVRLESH